MGKENGKRRQLTSETTGALILGLLAAVAFYVQGVPSDSGTVSPRETFLFNVVQFVLTLGFGWCLTRAASHNEFSISLKRFALSAYRRVADIDQMIDRLFSTLSRLREERGVESDHDLAIIEAIALDTKQTIRSSIAGLGGNYWRRVGYTSEHRSTRRGACTTTTAVREERRGKRASAA